MDEIKVQLAVEKLDEFSQYEGTEVGELWSLMSRMWSSYRDYISSDLLKALEKEITESAEILNKQYKIVEETIKRPPVKRKVLEYIGDRVEMIDMIGRVCKNCFQGTYRETSIQDDLDGVLHCNECGYKTDRYINSNET